MNDYETLGIPYGSSKDEIKKAFRRLAHIHHPDKAGGDAKKFSDVSSAYSRLMREERPPPNSGSGGGRSGFWENDWTSGFWGTSSYEEMMRKANQQQYQKQQQQQKKANDNMWQKYRNDELRRQVDGLLNQMTNVRRMHMGGRVWVNYTD